MCMLIHVIIHVINHVNATHMCQDVLTFKGKNIHLEGKKIIKCNLLINTFYQF